MSIISGESRLRSSLNSIRIGAVPAWLEIMLLLGLGAAVVVFHAYDKTPLHLPGRHGLEWMALLIVGRSLSRNPWGATISSVGAASLAFLPVWGFGDPFMPLIYFLPGLILDFGFKIGRRWQEHILFLAALGGLAMVVKPLLRLVINLITGWPYGSLLYGVAYPVATHIIFGFAGAFAGALILFAVRRHADPASKK